MDYSYKKNIKILWTIKLLILEQYGQGLSVSEVKDYSENRIDMFR